MKGKQENGPETPANRNEEPHPVWHCSIYCRKVRHIYCKGQEYVKEDAPDLCPYFDEMLY